METIDFCGTLADRRGGTISNSSKILFRRQISREKRSRPPDTGSAATRIPPLPRQRSCWTPAVADAPHGPGPQRRARPTWRIPTAFTCLDRGADGHWRVLFLSSSFATSDGKSFLGHSGELVLASVLYHQYVAVWRSVCCSVSRVLQCVAACVPQYAWCVCVAGCRSVCTAFVCFSVSHRGAPPKEKSY